MSLIDEIKRNKLVAVIRNADEQNIVPILEALAAVGVSTVEITAETPHVEKVIEKAVEEIGDKVDIGAGTVLDAETPRRVIMAGATFIVSPTLNTATLELTKRYNILKKKDLFIHNVIYT